MKKFLALIIFSLCSVSFAGKVSDFTDGDCIIYNSYVYEVMTYEWEGETYYIGKSEVEIIGLPKDGKAIDVADTVR